MAIEIISGFHSRSRENLDKRSGPYESLQDALAALSQQERFVGLKVLIANGAVKDEAGNFIGGRLSEYIFDEGITDNNLKPVLEVIEGDEKIYTTLTANSDLEVILDAKTVRNAIIELNDNYTLKIINFSNKTSGSILVKQPIGLKYLSRPDGAKGDFQHQLETDSSTLIRFFVVNGEIHFSNHNVEIPAAYSNPSKIENAYIDYVDAEQALMYFEAPYGNSPLESVDFYELRVAEYEIADESTFNTARPVANLPVPTTPGEFQSTIIDGLRPNNDYYAVIRAVKVNYGVRYYGPLSDQVTFKTLDFANTAVPLRIPLYDFSIEDYIDWAAEGTSAKYLVDISDTTFDAQGFPEGKKGANGGTYNYFSQDYRAKLELPYDIDIDLKAQFFIERWYFQRHQFSSSNSISLYIKETELSPWERVGEMGSGGSSSWHYETINRNVRYVRMRWDDNFDITAIEKEDNSVDYNYNDRAFAALACVIPYGRLVSGSLNASIFPAARMSRPLRTFREYLGTNAILTSPFDLLRPVCGPEVRLYANATFFSGEDFDYVYKDNQEIPTYQPSGINDLKFYFENSHMGDLDALLQKIYDNGGKTIICTQGNFFWSSFRVKDYDASVGGVLRPKPNDERITLGEYPPLLGNNIAHMESFEKPENYRSHAALAYEIGVRYGSATHAGSDRLGVTRDGETQSFKSGLNLIGGVEIQNEPDRNWHGRYAYFRPEELAAMISASYDGHNNTLEDEDGNKNFGLKNADPNLQYILPGMAFSKKGYFEAMVKWWKAHRSDHSMPFDAVNWHHYSSSSGGQGYDPNATGVSIEFDDYLKPDGKLVELVNMRDRYFPEKEFWLSEWGVSEHGISDEIGGRIFAPPNLGPHHKSHVRGAWTIRGLIFHKSIGIDVTNHYWLDDTGVNYFDREPELWRWDGVSNTGYREKTDFSGFKFATMGLVSGRWNGYYPIKPAYFYVSTMMKSIGDYHFVRWVEHSNPYIYIASFVKSDDDTKSVYVVWSATPYPLDEPPTNSNYADYVYNNVTIELPTGSTAAIQRTVNVPTFPTPWDGIVFPKAINNVGQPPSITDGSGNPKATAQVSEQPIQVAAWKTWIEDPGNATYLEGITETLTVNSGITVVDEVSEFPIFIEIDGGRDYPIPGQITDLFAEAMSTTVIRLKFNNEKTTDFRFDVFMGTAAENLTLQGTYTPADNEIDITGLNTGTQYFFKVRVNGDNSQSGELSNLASDTTQNPVPDVTNFANGTITSSSVDLTWDYVDEATLPEFENFAIYMSQNPVSDYAFMGFAAAGSRNFVVSGLTHNTTYYFRMKAIGSLGDSAYTGVSTLTTLDITQEPPLIVSAVTDNFGNVVVLDFNVSMSETLFTQGWQVFQYDVGNTGNGTFFPVDSVTRVTPTRYALNLGVSMSETAGDVLLSYDKLSGTETRSSFDLHLESFTNRIVVNYIGEAVGFLNRIKMSFRTSTEELSVNNNSVAYDVAPPFGWNDINRDPKIGDFEFPLTYDSTLAAPITLYLPPFSRNAGETAWGRGSSNGTDALDPIEYPESVTKGIWESATYHDDEFYSYLILRNVPNVNVAASLLVYSGLDFGSATGRDVELEANGVIANFNTYNNDAPVVLANVVADVNNEIKITFKNNTSDTNAMPVSFVILELYDTTA